MSIKAINPSTFYPALRVEFLRFCEALEVETKEFGLIALGTTLLGSQKYFVDEIFKGLEEGIHYFVCLKGRQLGISTICMALDLFWLFRFPGMAGTLALDTEETRELFRSTLTMYMQGLPQRWKQPEDAHNRTHLVLKNRSRLSYQVAGTRKNVGFGAGKAIAFAHSTEVGKWGEGTDISSFEASFAENNPHRLYIWESTAYGMNNWMDMYDTALTATSQRAIFIGWWRNEMYRVAEDSEIYKVYWDGRLTNEESVWVKDVKELYDFDIDSEQIAWHRFTLNEKMKEDEQAMHEKYPPTAEYAFIMSGSQFFSAQRLTDQVKIVKARPYEIKRFVFGAAFEDTVLVDCVERTATLKIWQTPVMKGQYVLGCDPAWGSSDWADRFAISVNRCWADGTEQVAEFCTPDLNTMQFAWVMLYLAGAYGDPNLQANVMMNLEINGPGQAVWQEIQSLKQRAFMMKDQSNLARLLINIQNYLYRRPDSTAGGFSYHTKTSQNEKERYLNAMKDHHEFGTLVINSVECLNEMKNVVRDEGQIGVPGRGKDDRVIAEALAVIAWTDFVRTRLIQAGITKEKQRIQEEMPETLQAAGRSVDNYLKFIGLKPKQSAHNRG